MTPCTTCGGRCPTPQACQLPTQYEEEPTSTAFSLVLWICCCIAVLGLVSFIAGLCAGFN